MAVKTGMTKKVYYGVLMVSESVMFNIADLRIEVNLNIPLRQTKHNNGFVIPYYYSSKGNKNKQTTKQNHEP